jgi:transposase
MQMRIPGHADPAQADGGCETAASVLGESQGFLLVDAYSGYNRVTTPKGRKRVGCWAHVRRKFFDALEYAPKECRHALDVILEL